MKYKIFDEVNKVGNLKIGDKLISLENNAENDLIKDEIYTFLKFQRVIGIIYAKRLTDDSVVGVFPDRLALLVSLKKKIG